MEKDRISLLEKVNQDFFGAKGTRHFWRGWRYSLYSQYRQIHTGTGIFRIHQNGIVRGHVIVRNFRASQIPSLMKHADMEVCKEPWGYSNS